MVRIVPPIAFVAASLAFWTSGHAPAAEDQPLSPEHIQFFESQVRPVLVEQCLGCHGEKKVKAGLRLDSRASALLGGDSGPAIVPGKPEESPLVAAIRYEGPEMPPKGKLPRRQVEALTQWVKMGAPWPGGDKPAAGAAEPALEHPSTWLSSHRCRSRSLGLPAAPQAGRPDDPGIDPRLSSRSTPSSGRDWTPKGSSPTRPPRSMS